MARKQTLQEYGVNEVVTEIKESVSVVCSQVLYPLEGPQHADVPLDHWKHPCMWTLTSPVIVCIDGSKASYVFLHEKIPALLLNCLHNFSMD